MRGHTGNVLRNRFGRFVRRSAEKSRLPARQTVKPAEEEINLGVGSTDALSSSSNERKAF
jgi:hypothetical protein